MSLILRSDSSMTSPHPDTPTLVLPEPPVGALLEWDARDLALGPFTEWRDRRTGLLITEPLNSASTVIDYQGDRGVSVEATSLLATRLLSGDVTKSIVYTPTAHASGARLFTSGAANYRGQRVRSGQWVLNANVGDEHPYASAPGTLDRVQIHTAAWEAGSTGRVAVDDGQVQEFPGEYPTTDTDEICIAGIGSTSPSSTPGNGLTGVIHKIMIYNRALTPAEIEGLNLSLMSEWS